MKQREPMGLELTASVPYLDKFTQQKFKMDIDQVSSKQLYKRLSNRQCKQVDMDGVIIHHEGSWTNVFISWESAHYLNKKHCKFDSY